MKRLLFNPLIQSILLTAAIVCATLLAGCAQLGLTTPQSTTDKVQYAKAGVSGAYKSIGDLKAAGSISEDQGVDLFKRTARVERDVRTIESMLASGNPTDQSNAAAKLELALQALLVLQQELRSRQGQKAALILQPAIAA